MKNLLTPRAIKIIISLAVPIVILLLPPSFFLSDLTVTEHRVIALFFFAALFWVLEPIPIYATSILIIAIELFILSDSSLIFFKGDGPEFGILLSFKEIMATLASPVIVLFLGGFFLAAAATKYGLDQSLSRILLSRFGEKPHWVLLGVMTLTATFSMFMSNTATTAMMLSILIPILKLFPEDDKGRSAFVLAIPIAANLGGIGTPIGTPPNAIALRFISDGANAITFGEWMAFGVPFVLIMIVASWLLLLFFFPIRTKKIKVVIDGSFGTTPKAIIVYVTFAVTIIMWLLDFAHGVNSYVVATIPMAVFLATGIINKEDIKQISWEVLWLVSGGLALGLAIEKTGFATHIITAIPFHTLNPYVVLATAALIGFFMANFMSHTATSNLLLPLLAALGSTVAGLDLIGGKQALVLSATFAISLGMSLPISSPPNALAHATGAFRTPDLAKVGLSVGIVGLILTALLMGVLQMLNFFS